MQLVATFFGQRQTDQAAGMTGHEVDDLWSDFLGRADEIAFVLAVFVVNDDDHAAVADVGDGFVNSRNRHEGMLTESVRPRKAARVAQTQRSC